IAIRPGTEDLPAVMTGSHIDTVASGGRFDGNYGVIAGLEVVETLNENNIQCKHPIAVTVFTNEEGTRYTPDMTGSLAYAKGIKIEDALAIVGNDGSIFGEELKRIGYAGDIPCGKIPVHAFVEVHIEQGPLLEKEDTLIGAVENLVGISWKKLTITGENNHAGTTPTNLRHDAGYAAAQIVSFIRELAISLGENQRCTAGAIEFFPNQINVVPGKATMTVDMRNSEDAPLEEADCRLDEFIKQIAEKEGVEINCEQLARFPSIQFDQSIVQDITDICRELDYSVRPMTSGAVHDAQMMGRICPTAMIFVPSKDGISHNPAEYTSPEELGAGCNVLLHSLLKLAQ
ncbi:MAG: M20 family metallo-hydrolase, partial [Planctomycetes bacterium]|nr:M20 family metallo-hydrolase [Planctomycetota bacterium]